MTQVRRPPRTRIASAKWKRLFDAVYEMNVARDHADFVAAVLAGMGRLIAADLCVLHVLDRAGQRLVHQTSPADAFTKEELAYYASHPQEFPLVAYYDRSGDTRARRLSEVADITRFRRSEFYRRCLSRLSLPYCLSIPVTVDSTTVAGLSFSRRRSDFTVGQRDLLDAFAPHFRRAWLLHPSPWEQARRAGPSADGDLRRFALTPRESDVLYWMTQGKRNREIAIILDRSLQTIQEHVANVTRKLGQENRDAATVFALRLLLSDPEPD